jgi:aminopeptidase N
LLLEARSETHPRVRRAMAAGLGEFRGDGRAQDVLAGWAKKGDPSLFVEAETALALGKTRAPQAAEILKEVAGRPSYQETIRARAFEGLGALGGERAIAILCESWRAGGPFQARKAAAAALGEAANGTPQARQTREFLEERLTDPDFRVRGEIAAALARIGDRQAIAAIERALASELDGRARRRMREAVTTLREGSGTTTQVARLQDEVERLRTETTKLRERLDKLEARDHGAKPSAGPSGATRATPAPRHHPATGAHSRPDAPSVRALPTLTSEARR